MDTVIHISSRGGPEPEQSVSFRFAACPYPVGLQNKGCDPSLCFGSSRLAPCPRRIWVAWLYLGHRPHKIYLVGFKAHTELKALSWWVGEADFHRALYALLAPVHSVHRKIIELFELEDPHLASLGRSRPQTAAAPRSPPTCGSTSAGWHGPDPPQSRWRLMSPTLILPSWKQIP